MGDNRRSKWFKENEPVLKEQSDTQKRVSFDAVRLNIMEAIGKNGVIGQNVLVKFILCLYYKG